MDTIILLLSHYTFFLISLLCNISGKTGLLISGMRYDKDNKRNITNIL